MVSFANSVNNSSKIFLENNYVGVKNGDCAQVGIEENATFEFTVTVDQCFTEQKEVVSDISW